MEHTIFINRKTNQLIHTTSKDLITKLNQCNELNCIGFISGYNLGFDKNSITAKQYLSDKKAVEVESIINVDSIKEYFQERIEEEEEKPTMKDFTRFLNTCENDFYEWLREQYKYYYINDFKPNKEDNS